MSGVDRETRKMDRNAFAFATLLILGGCYLAYITKSGTRQISYTVGIYDASVQREMNQASKFVQFLLTYTHDLIRSA